MTHHHDIERDEMSAKIVRAMRDRKLTFKAIAKQVGLSPFIVTAALLGQMSLPPDAAKKAAKALRMPAADSRIAGRARANRSYHLPLLRDLQAYRTTLKALIHEEFGDGIMSAIDFDLDLSRQPDPAGDRVRIVMTGKFLKYKKT